MTTAVQTRDKGDLRTFFQGDNVKEQMALALPKHMTPDRMVRVFLTAIYKTPKLQGCTRESLLNCLMQLSQCGLEPDGRLAHLIPYGDKCTLIIDYKGLISLVRRSGEVRDIYADIVCENDTFEWAKGKGRFLKHSYDLMKPRGPMIGAYSYVVPKDGEDSFEIMSKDEIDAIRARSRSSNDGPWKTDYAEMGKKTVFRRHSKWLPLSVELQRAIAADDDDLSPPDNGTQKPNMRKKASFLPEMPAAAPEQPAIDVESAVDTERADLDKDAAEAGLAPVTPAPQEMFPEPPHAASVKASVAKLAAKAPKKPEPAREAGPALLNEAEQWLLDGLKERMAASGIEELSLVFWGRRNFNWPRDIIELSRIAAERPDHIKEILDTWENVKDQIAH